MSFIKQVCRRSVLFALLLASGAVGLIQADPSDDLSFTLHSPVADSNRTMSEAEVARILQDRLDLFPKSRIPRLSNHLVRLCQEYRFDPAFVLSLIEVESRFRIKAQSPVGAMGLMQIMPATGIVIARQMEAEQLYPGIAPALKRHDETAFSRHLQDPFLNLELGVAYLAQLRDRYRTLSPYYLVAAYNVGPARLDELLARKTFRPTGTKKYYEAIRKNLPAFRFYQGPEPVRRAPMRSTKRIEA